MKVDIHTHIIPSKMPNWVEKFGYGEFIHLEHKDCGAAMMIGDRLFRNIEPNCYDEGVRIKEMDETEVAIQVLSPIPVLFNYWARPEDALQTSRFFNDHIAETVSKFPERFIGLGTVPLQDTDIAIREMQRCVNELGLRGVEIGTNVNDLNLSEERFYSFFHAAEAMNCSLFVHPWNMMGEKQMQKYWLPWLVGMPAETSRAICSMIFAGIFEKLPDLRVAFAHGGGSFPFTAGRIAHGHEVRPDLVQIDNKVDPRDYLGSFWVDSLVHDHLALEYLITIIGEDRICLGSDYPFPLGEKHPGHLIEHMDLGKRTRRKLYYRNAYEWLGLEEPKRGRGNRK